MKGTLRSTPWSSSITETRPADFASDASVWRCASLSGGNGGRERMSALANPERIADIGRSHGGWRRGSGHFDRSAFVLLCCVRGGHDGRDPQDRCDTGCRRRRLQPDGERGRGRHACAVAHSALGADRSYRRRPERARVQAHWRRRARRVSQRCRGGQMRDHDPERDDRTKRRRAPRAPHRVPHRRPPRRRRRGERRRPHGRRRQHRGPIGRDRRTGSDMSVRRRLSAGEWPAQYGSIRSRSDAAKEHREAHPRLFAASGRPRPAEAGAGGGTGNASQASRAESVQAGPRSPPRSRRCSS